MGTYTDHWQTHRRTGRRGTLVVLAWLVVGLPLTAVVALGVERLTGSYPGYLHAGLIALWLVVFTVLVLRFSRVLCPRCGTRYSLGKWVMRCPSCGLAIGQEEP